MEPTMQDRNWVTIDQFVNDFNQHRLANRAQWIAYAGNVCGRHVVIKNWNLWTQRLVVDGVHHERSYPALSTRAWKATIADAISYQAPACLTGAIVNVEAVTW
jgi:hypothetical protein